MNDPLDIPMTADDIQDMDPCMVANMWAKVLADRNDLRDQRADLLEQQERMIEERTFMTTSRNETILEMKAARHELEIQCGINSEVADELDRCIRALAKVALRSIEHGDEYQ